MLLCLASLTLPLHAALDTTAPDTATVQRRSAISRLNRVTSLQVLMPNRLILGQDNTFTARTEPNHTVWLVYAAQPDANGGLPLASGQTFPLPWPSPYVEAVANAQGVAVLTLPIPLQQDLNGATVTLAALTFPPNQPDDAKLMTLLDGATGKAGLQVELTLVLPDEGSKGIGFLPLLPGLDPSTMRQIQQASELIQNEEKRGRLWNDGSLSRGTQSQRNTLLLPGSGGTGGVLNP